MAQSGGALMLAPQQAQGERLKNVGDGERLLSALVGATLLGLTPRMRATSAVVAGVSGAALLRRAWTGQCSVCHALGKHDIESGPLTAVRARRGVHFERAMVIRQPAASIYRFWRALDNLPRIIDHLESVVEDGERSVWTARGPVGVLEWEVEIHEQRPNELIAWRSLPDSQVATAGSLRLEELSHDRGTSVRLTLKYDPPGGSVGDLVGRMLGTNVESELTDGLRRMKQLLETGEVSTTSGQPRGHCVAQGYGRSIR